MSTQHNPINKKVEWKGLGLFKKRPVAEPGTALVLYRNGGAPVEIPSGGKITGGEVAWGNFQGYYIVNVGEKSFSFSAGLPCQKDAFNFQAEVQVTYQVYKPASVVQNNITNARELLEALIINIMRQKSRKFPPEESKDAEVQIMDFFMKENIAHSGIRIKRVIANINLDDTSKLHLAQLTQLEREQVTVRAQHDVSRLKEQLEIERKKMKMEFYGPLIEKGQWQLLALQLASNEGDVIAVSNMLNAQRQIEMDAQLSALKILLEGDAIEGFQVGDAGKQILKKLVDNINPEVSTNLFDPPPSKQLPNDDNGNAQDA